MAGELRIRRYEDPDADAVWTLHRRAMRDAGTDPDDVPGADDVRRVRENYLATGGEFLVGVLPGVEEDPDLATSDGELVAMGGFVPSDAGLDEERPVPDAAELHRMRVDPDRQRRGYGRRILDALESRAREAGYDRLLATTALRQASAVDFYPSEGYEEAGRSTHGEYDLVHYEKRL